MVALTGSLHRPLSPRVLTKRSQQEGLIETGRNTGHRAADGIRLIFGKRTRCTIARLRGCAVARFCPAQASPDVADFFICCAIHLNGSGRECQAYFLDFFRARIPASRTWPVKTTLRRLVRAPLVRQRHKTRLDLHSEGLNSSRGETPKPAPLHQKCPSDNVHSSKPCVWAAT